MTKTELLELLPPYQGKEQVITDDQGTKDIVQEVLKAHRVFAPDYDKIADEWMTGDLSKVPYRLYRFCKDKMTYKEEDITDQTTRSPAGILALKYVDCKHYSGWIAGVLDAINRTKDYYYDWCYRFASYSMLKPNPGHVFVVIKDKESGEEWWIDPVPEMAGFNARNLKPWYTWDKKPTMALTRLSGVGDRFENPEARPANMMGIVRKGGISPYIGYAKMGATAIGATSAAEQQLLDQLKAFEMGLPTAVANLTNKNQLSSTTDEILEAAATAIPGAAQALAYAKGITQTLSTTFGAGSPLTRIAEAITSGNPLNIISAVFNGRTYNTDNYQGASDYSYYVKGIDVGASTNVPDQDVLPALKWFILKTGVFVSGRVHINALRQGVAAYLALDKVNSYTTDDPVRVKLAVDVVQKYMNTSAGLKGWANTIGVYDNAVTAAVVKARLQDPNAVVNADGTVATTPTTQASMTNLKPLLIIGGIAGGLWILSSMFKKRRR